MNPEIAEAIYDHVVPKWRDAPIRNGHRRVCAPYRDDKHPSLDIHEDTLTWYDRSCSDIPVNSFTRRTKKNVEAASFRLRQHSHSNRRATNLDRQDVRPLQIRTYRK